MATFAEEMLQKIEDLLRGKADSDIKTFQYNGKMLSKYSFEDLLKLRDKFKAEVAAEKRAQELAEGTGVDPRFVKVRF